MNEQTQNNRYVLEYELPYVHTVRVGVTAVTDECAIKQASELFEAGTVWDNTDQVPLLYDDYDETGDAPVTFTVIEKLPADAGWPEAASCVSQIQRREAAFEACRLLVDAFHASDTRVADIDYDKLRYAYEVALKSI